MKKLSKIYANFSKLEKTLLACIIYYGGVQLIFKLLGV